MTENSKQAKNLYTQGVENQCSKAMIRGVKCLHIRTTNTEHGGTVATAHYSKVWNSNINELMARQSKEHCLKVSP